MLRSREDWIKLFSSLQNADELYESEGKTRYIALMFFLFVVTCY